MKLLTIFVLFIISFTASAGEVEMNEMFCDKTTFIFQTLKKEYYEIPVLTGKADDIAKSTMSIWTNPKTNSWTIVATKDDLSCIIGVGSDLKIIDYSKKKMI